MSFDQSLTVKTPTIVNQIDIGQIQSHDNAQEQQSQDSNRVYKLPSTFNAGLSPRSKENFRNQIYAMNEKINEQFIGLKVNGIGSNSRKICLAAENYTNSSN